MIYAETESKEWDVIRKNWE